MTISEYINNHKNKMIIKGNEIENASMVNIINMLTEDKDSEFSEYITNFKALSINDLNSFVETNASDFTDNQRKELLDVIEKYDCFKEFIMDFNSIASTISWKPGNILINDINQNLVTADLYMNECYPSVIEKILEIIDNIIRRKEYNNEIYSNINVKNIHSVFLKLLNKNNYCDFYSIVGNFLNENSNLICYEGEIMEKIKETFTVHYNNISF